MVQKLVGAAERRRLRTLSLLCQGCRGGNTGSVDRRRKEGHDVVGRDLDIETAVAA